MFHIIHAPAVIFSSSLEILTDKVHLDLHPGLWKFLVKIVCLNWVLHLVASSFGTVASSFPLACYAFASTFKVLLVARHLPPEIKPFSTMPIVCFISINRKRNCPEVLNLDVTAYILRELKIGKF